MWWLLILAVFQEASAISACSTQEQQEGLRLLQTELPLHRSLLQKVSLTAPQNTVPLVEKRTTSARLSDSSAKDDGPLTLHQALPQRASTVHDHTKRSQRPVQFREHYSRFGRMPSHVVPGDVFLDYEVQYGLLHVTPDVLLDSVYSVAFQRRSCASKHEPAFGNASRWFTLGTDGASLQRQDFNVELEATSARMMSAKDVLESSFLPDIQALVDSTNHAGAEVPGTSGRITMRKGTPKIMMQYTVGLHLSQVPLLLKNSPANDIWQRAEERCKDKPVLYQALVALAAMTAQGVTGHGCHGSGCHGSGCMHAKRYLVPWLVRTHFGDLAKYVASKIGSEALQSLPKDVLAVSQVGPSDQAFPFGVVDYLHMLEIAEVAQLTPRVTPGTRPSPRQLCSLGRSAVNHMASVKKSMRQLGCGVYGFNATAAGLVESEVEDHKQVLSAIASPTLWLESMLEGQDLWTDKESLASLNSKSNLIFKSMGSWRMDPGEGAGYVYMESVGRSENGVDNHKMKISERMRQVAQELADLFG